MTTTTLMICVIVNKSDEKLRSSTLTIIRAFNFPGRKKKPIHFEGRQNEDMTFRRALTAIYIEYTFIVIMVLRVGTVFTCR